MEHHLTTHCIFSISVGELRQLTVLRLDQVLRHVSQWKLTTKDVRVLQGKCHREVVSLDRGDVNIAQFH